MKRSAVIIGGKETRSSLMTGIFKITRDLAHSALRIRKRPLFARWPLRLLGATSMAIWPFGRFPRPCARARAARESRKIGGGNGCRPGRGPGIGSEPGGTVDGDVRGGGYEGIRTIYGSLHSQSKARCKGSSRARARETINLTACIRAVRAIRDSV